MNQRIANKIYKNPIRHSLGQYRKACRMRKYKLLPSTKRFTETLRYLFNNVSKVAAVDLERENK